MSKILVVDDDPVIRALLQEALESEGHTLLQAPDGQRALEVLAQEGVDLVLTDFLMPGMDGIEFLERVRHTSRFSQDLRCIMITAHGTPDVVLGALREQVCDFLVKPFSLEELRSAVGAALARQSSCDIQVISALPEWVELLVPCKLEAVSTLEKMLTQLMSDLPQQTREAIAFAFREMLNNAIEHGGKLDPARFVTVSCVCLKRAIIYRIKDPGQGFDPVRLDHAAASNLVEDLLYHSSVRESRGMRAGGLGILLTRQLVDELVYNERHNELMFVKYLS